jgi:hypothetical protein
MKKLRNISMLGLSLFLVACGGNTSSAAPDTTNSGAVVDSSEQASSTSYPKVTTFVLRASVKEVEVGHTIEINSILNGPSDKTVTFTSSDENVATVAALEGSAGKKAVLTALKEGKVTITGTSNANPTAKATIEITIIKEIPSLRQVLTNIQKLDSYTLDITVSEDDGPDEDVAKEIVMNDRIIYSDTYGSALYKNSSNQNGIVGEIVTEDGKVVYIEEDGSSYKASNATIVQSNLGLLNKDNFKGAKSNAKQAFEVGDFYSLDAINPNWVTDVKDADNTYVINGEALDSETGKATNILGAYVECQLWNLMDKTDYDTAAASLGEAYYYSMAAQVETTIKAESSSSISVTIEYGTSVYTMTMSDINQTTMENDVCGVDDSMDNATASAPTIASSLTLAIDAIKTNNYVQVNSMFPDHKTELKFNTYYTSTYVFYDCTAEFKEQYNALIGGVADATEWTKAPYGYVKKSDGVYKFTYNETEKTITLNTTKEDNTDANTNFVDYMGYLSTISTFNSDLKYAFQDKEMQAIWSQHDTKYYVTTSRTVFDEFINYYAPEDIADVIENTKAGIGVVLDDNNKVTTVNGTLGYTPFDGSTSDITTHTYGVDYFQLTSFGSATTNNVDSLLK